MINTKGLLIRILVAGVGGGLISLFQWFMKKGRDNKTITNEGNGGEVYLWPRSYSLLGILPGLMALGTLGAFIYGYFFSNDPVPSGVMLVFGPLGTFMFGYMAVHLLRLMDYRVVVTKNGITEIRHGKSTSLEWSKIEKIEGKRRMQRLVLIGFDGTKLKLEYQLRNFNKLASNVLENVTIKLHEDELPKAFGNRNFKNRSGINYAIMCLFGIGLCFAPMENGSMLGMTIVGIAIFSYFVNRKNKQTQVRFIEVGRKEVRIEGFNQNEVIPIEKIVSANIDSYFEQNSNTRLRTVIKTSQNEYLVHASIADPIALVSVLRRLMA